MKRFTTKLNMFALLILSLTCNSAWAQFNKNPNNFVRIPMPTTLNSDQQKEIRELHRLMTAFRRDLLTQARGHIARSTLNNACHCRAQTLSNAVANRTETTFSGYLNLHIDTTNASQSTPPAPPWGWHVAPMVRLKDGRTFVADSLMGFLTPAEWITETRQTVNLEPWAAQVRFEVVRGDQLKPNVQNPEVITQYRLRFRGLGPRATIHEHFNDKVREVIESVGAAGVRPSQSRIDLLKELMLSQAQRVGDARYFDEIETALYERDDWTIPNLKKYLKTIVRRDSTWWGASKTKAVLKWFDRLCITEP